jgi:cysteine synthase
MPTSKSFVFNQFCHLIGSTPLTKITFRYLGEEHTVYVKNENYNLTGSVKDRMAFHILFHASRSGILKPTTTIVEATSGNTGISFSALGRALGNPVRIYMPDWMSQERVNLMKSYGAEVVLVSREQGGFVGSIRLANDYASLHPDTFLPSQFSNPLNSEAHYLTTGPEIWHQMEHMGVIPDAFVAGVGTGGTVMGVGRYLREMNPAVKIYPLEPANSPTLSTGCKVGKHRIAGISDEFIPALCRLDQLDEVISIDDGDAILMAQKLACSLGMGVGISSGANFLGALMAQKRLGRNAVVVTVFSDDNKKYLSTDLMKNETVKPGYLTPDIDSLSIDSVINMQDLPFCHLYQGI